MEANGQGVLTSAPKVATGDAILWAIAGSLIVNVVSMAALALPGFGDVPGTVYVVGSILAVTALVGAWGLWNHRVWGYRTTMIVTIVNAVLSLGAFTDSPTVALVALIIVLTVLSVAVVVMLRQPGVRAQMS